jgi:hypothetical protein
MTWRLYALTSGGAVVVTTLATLLAPTERTADLPTTVPQAVDRSGAVVDLGVQADRLQAKLAQVTAYREPARNAFRFGPPPRRAAAAPPAQVSEGPVSVAPARPPYGLAGMATTFEEGIPRRTAILSSLEGVLLVNEGDVLEAGYRVLAVTDDAVSLESTVDGVRMTLRLSGSDSR